MNPANFLDRSATFSARIVRWGILFCGAMLVFSSVSTVEAQYYPPSPNGYYRSAPPPGYYQQRRHRPQPRYSPYVDDGYAVRPRRRAFGSICVTSRGSCSIGRPVPLPAGCVCHIPGFGKKRGAVQ